MAQAYGTDATTSSVGVVTAATGGGVAGAVRRVSWGAVLAGVAVILVLHILLSLLGVGIGLATFDPGTGDNPSPATFSIATVAFWAVGGIVVTYVGAWIAGRLAGIPNRTDGMLHGVVTWSVATLVLVYLLTSTLSSLLGGAASLVGNTVQAAAQGAQGVASGALQALPDDLRAQAERLFERAPGAAQDAAQQAQQATGAPNTAEAVRRVVAGVREGASPQDRQAAVNLIAQQSGIPPQEAETRLNQFQEAYRQTVEQAEETAIRAKEAAAQGALYTFAALLVLLVTAAIGGRAGAPDYEDEASSSYDARYAS